jgi:outer membrane translocation and assembly module TamA
MGEPASLASRILCARDKWCNRLLSTVVAGQPIGATILSMRIGSLLGAILVLATAVAGQTATGIRLIDVQFRGIRHLEAVDLRKCAADLKSRTYEGPGWLAYITERVRLQCFQDKGYFKALVEPSTKQLPDKEGTHQFVVTFNIDAGSQYRIGQISFRSNRVLSSEELRTMFKLTSGDIFSPAKISQVVDQIRRTYAGRGYPDSTMIPNANIDDSRHVISMVFDCDEGKQVH